MSKITTYKLQLHTETPVSIYSDHADILSPYTDFVVSQDEKWIHYIDQNLLVDALEKQNKMGEFSASFETVENNTSKLRLKSFIENQLRMDVASLTKLSIRNEGYGATQNIEVHPILKTAGRPFIPGSSIKGAIRTALLYRWLNKTSEGQQMMRNAYKIVMECDEILGEIAPIRAKKKKRIQPSKRESQLLRDAQREVRNKLRRILPEESLFGKVNDRKQAPDSQHIRVSDTQRFSASDMIFCRAERIRLAPLGGNRFGRANQATIPQPREAISEGLDSSFEIGLRADSLQAKELQFLRNEGIDGLLESIYAFSKACIGFELDSLEFAEEMPDRAAHNNLINFYTRLYDRADEGEIFMRIGLGKTIFDNSLALAFYHYAEDHHPEGVQAFLRFRRVVHEVGMSKDHFPVTRTVLKPGNVPLGWINLKLLK